MQSKQVNPVKHISELSPELQTLARKFQYWQQAGLLRFDERFYFVLDALSLQEQGVPFESRFVNASESARQTTLTFMGDMLEYRIVPSFFEKKKVNIEVWLVMDPSSSFDVEGIFATRINARNRPNWENEIKEGNYKLLNKTFIEVEEE